MKPTVDLIVIGASTGGINALSSILPLLPANLPVPILYIQHLIPQRDSRLAETLTLSTALRVCWVNHNEHLAAGTLYLCPPGYSVNLNADGSVSLDKLNSGIEQRHIINEAFSSAAAAYGSRVAAILLAGFGMDGVEGIYQIQQGNGIVIMQDQGANGAQDEPKTSLAMPYVRHFRTLSQIAPAILSLVYSDFRSANEIIEVDHAVDFLPHRLQNSLNYLLNISMALHQTNLGNIQLLDSKTGVLTIVAQRGFKLDFLDHFRTVTTADGSACGRALQTGQAIQIQNIKQDREYEEHFEIATRAGYQGVQSTPLTSRRGIVYGMVSTHFASPDQISGERIQVPNIYTEPVADLIEQATTNTVSTS